MKKIFHPASERGRSKTEWLDSKHSFSFNEYYDRQKMGFGSLVVLNDDVILPDVGFPSHPHKDMEIITIMLQGELLHEDDANHAFTLKEHEVQVMSAGTGITHSEMNPSKAEVCELLQVWIVPNKKKVTPRYDHGTFLKKDRINQIQVVASGYGQGLEIYQNAVVSLLLIEPEKEVHYTLNSSDHGVYIFLIEGALEVEKEFLKERDALAIWDVEDILLKAKRKCEVLLIEVPLK
ncbi:MAG: pirin family protein [Candidatus Nanoarchaeia archaeon]